MKEKYKLDFEGEAQKNTKYETNKNHYSEPAPDRIREGVGAGVAAVRAINTPTSF